MSSLSPRTQVKDVSIFIPPQFVDPENHEGFGNGETTKIGTRTSKLWRSEGHPINRKTGKYDSGGPFHVTHTGSFIEPGFVQRMCRTVSGKDIFYTGPFIGPFVAATATGNHYSGTTKEMDEKSLSALGTTAISQCAPTNPTAELGTALAETFREGVPSLPGIQSWERRTRAAKSAGSEYLNYQFGWAPLQSEVQAVAYAARHHRDIMQNYRHNEGRNIHRRFEFPSSVERWEEEVSSSFALLGITGNAGFAQGGSPSRRTVSVVKESKRWFEGCFTYGGPGKADNFHRSLGFGKEADAVYGLALTPDVLWNLAPWSWAVDWFTNAGDVIHNITNFTLAGLVMRYGYMMEESIEKLSTNYGDQFVRFRERPGKYVTKNVGGCSIGFETVRKSRCPASPFGFGVGWEGLSPTQLAITAALGITRLL